MKTNISIIKIAILAIALAAMPAIAAAQTTELGGNIYLMSRLLNFTRGQAVSIHFTNVDRVTRDVKIYFADANGMIIKSSLSRVAPGQTTDSLLNFAELPRTSPIRVGVRGVVVVSAPTDSTVDPPDPDLSFANMEVFDVLTGRTSFGLLLPAVRNLNVYFPTDQ